MELLICDELGYLSFSRTGAERLFQVFADRYERASLLITSNLPFSEWMQVFHGERMTAALLDRLTRGVVVSSVRRPLRTRTHGSDVGGWSLGNAKKFILGAAAHDEGLAQAD